MKKRVLSLCLSLTIMMTAGGVSGLAVSASEVAGEGSSTGAMEETEYSDPSEEEDGYAEEGETTSEIAVPEDVMLTPAEAAALSENTAADTADTAAAAEEIPTDAAGQVIAPETAEAIDNADVGATALQQTARDEASSVANGAEEAMQAPESADAEMNKSTIGAAFDSAYEFVKEDAIVYLTEAASVKAEPSDDAEDIANLEKYSSVHLTGSSDAKYWEVTVGGRIGYLDSAVIAWENSEVEDLKEDDIRKEETEAQSRQDQEDIIVEKTSEAREEWAEAIKDGRREELANQTRSLNWSGAVLSRGNGSVYGPSGKETYYNLNMSGCVRNMNRRGYYYDVWVRNDGCKMFGDYIMCAANLGVHPFGSLVECSLGTCIVVDTGGFAAGNPNQLDIAVTW
jgi:hypothetical protein